MFSINDVRPVSQMSLPKEHIHIMFNRMVQDSQSTYAGLPIGAYLFTYMLLQEINQDQGKLAALGLEPLIIEWYEESKKRNPLFVKQKLQQNTRRNNHAEAIAAD